MNPGAYGMAASPGATGVRIPSRLFNNASALRSGISTLLNAANTTAISSGSLTAGVLKTVLSVSGRGALNFAALSSNDATARTIRIRITIDGNQVVDASNTAGAAADGLIAVGAGISGTNVAILQPLLFETQLLIEVSSSLTESNLATTFVNYETHV